MQGWTQFRNGKDLTDTVETKKWEEYTEELYRKGLNAPNNHNGVVTHLELDILEGEVTWALRSILVAMMEFHLSSLKSEKMLLLKCYTQYVSN